MTDRPHVARRRRRHHRRIDCLSPGQIGARVTILDVNAPGGIATRHSWAWINASWGNPEPYFRLRVRAMADWRRLAVERPGDPRELGGRPALGHPPAELDAYAAQHSRLGLRHRAVSVPLPSRSALSRPWRHHPAFAVHVAEEGALDPLATAQALLAAATRARCRSPLPCRCRSLDMAGGRVTGVITCGGPPCRRSSWSSPPAPSGGTGRHAPVSMVPMSGAAGLAGGDRPAASNC